ncbi:MAG TPA: HDIG domain-containing protein [Longimicrobiales bacterium]|nr:HDIG domain-containing protein [Longimicrobiales bacterium]
MTAHEFFHILSTRPRDRGKAWLHHGARAVLLLGLALATTLMFPVAPLPDFPFLERGMVANEDVVAEVTAPIYKSAAELARARQDAAASVTPIFVYDSTAVDSMLAQVERFFVRVDSVAATTGTRSVVRQRIADLLGAYGIPPSTEDLDLLENESQRRRLRATVRMAITSELPRGIAVPGELEEAGSQELRLRGIGPERVMDADSMLTSVDLFDRAEIYLPSAIRPGYEQLQRLLLIKFFVPSVRPDWTATDQARQRNRAAVSLTKGEVLQGERIVAAGDRATDDQIERLRAYQAELERLGDLEGGQRGARTFGAFLFNLITLSLIAALLYFYRPNVYEDFRHVVLLGFLILALVAAAAIITTYEAPRALIPIAFPALVIATLWDGRLALSLSLILAIMLTGQAELTGISVLLTLAVAGAMASLSVRVVRRRAQIWSFIALITAGYVLVAVVLGLLRSWTLEEVFWASAWGAVTALGSAFMAMGFLPVFEGFTRITTDQSLLELADVNRPLLRRLSMEAPGTYAHSVNVANLAESAASAIGADALLTRVGVYYHDVGKMLRPHLYIENQHGGRNPHDKLKPATSAAQIRNHVIDGMRLAEEHKLPASVKAFIVEHHGTQPISFFYDQAREADPDATLDLRDFSYPGPRPQSRETAILMLADSVESAARVLPDPTPEAIRELVDRITRTKIDQGQLDEAPLTFRELTRIKEQFASGLSGMYHQRIDYPPRPDEPEREPSAERAGAGVP